MSAQRAAGPGHGAAEAAPAREHDLTQDPTLAERSLVFHRRFRAPRELVFRVWTEGQHIVHWWGPDGFTTTTTEMDVRPGGVWRFILHGPDGTDYPNRVVYLEIAPPERLVYRHDGDEGDEPVDFTVTVSFDQQGAETDMTMSMVFPTSAALREVVAKYGADEGAVQMMARLKAYLAALTAGGRG